MKIIWLSFLTVIQTLALAAPDRSQQHDAIAQAVASRELKLWIYDEQIGQYNVATWSPDGDRVLWKKYEPRPIEFYEVGKKPFCTSEFRYKTAAGESGSGALIWGGSATYVRWEWVKVSNHKGRVVYLEQQIPRSILIKFALEAPDEAAAEKIFAAATGIAQTCAADQPKDD